MTFISGKKKEKATQYGLKRIMHVVGWDLQFSCIQGNVLLLLHYCKINLIFNCGLLIKFKMLTLAAIYIC